MKLKQLFCTHIWKLDRSEYTRTYERLIGDTPIYQVNVYAGYYVCLKCEKTTIKEMEGTRNYNTGGWE